VGFENDPFFMVKYCRFAAKGFPMERLIASPSPRKKKGLSKSN